jgi:hypothetical protein
MSLQDTIRQILQQELRSFQNRTSPIAYHVHNGLDSAQIPAKNISGLFQYLSISATTNGTTPVNVFGVSGTPSNLTVTGVYLIDQDTTASNIVLKQAANTVTTIAKGTTSGGMTGGVSLAHTFYTKGDICTIVSSGTGNATVIITFTI